MLHAAVISLGLIGAGTNNAPIAGMLCNLSSYYYKGSNLLAAIASGLKSTRRPNTCLTSARVNLQVIGPEFSPQKSRISETLSKFRIFTI
ncbi:hypothetical protein JHK82_039103 [Glycine max]|nr:hypothetical protein JHK85_039864 [Glycine max]KAG5109880.1 hypothetical protein JHK82_039103 [Glycine max]KAG5121172.1 hypothetical protein JHK84_039512 [Glycine max]